MHDASSLDSRDWIRPLPLAVLTLDINIICPQEGMIRPGKRSLRTAIVVASMPESAS